MHIQANSFVRIVDPYRHSNTPGCRVIEAFVTSLLLEGDASAYFCRRYVDF